MSRLPVFLSLSVVLHMAGGLFLFGRDSAQAAVSPQHASAQPAVVQPTVVQVVLAPAAARQQPAAAKPVEYVAEQAPRIEPAKPVKPVTAAVKAKPQPAPVGVPAPLATPRSKAAAPPAPEPTEQFVAQSAQPQHRHPAQEQSMPVVAAAAASAPAPDVEVLSRHPAFRLPPQQPRYPAQARRRNQEGVVLLEVRLDAGGAQREIRLLRSSGFPSLDSAALKAVAEWRFHPEVIDGQGVPSRVQIPIEFALMASR